MWGHIEKVFVRVGSLSTPDVRVMDAITGENLLYATAISANTTYYPKVLNVDVDGTGLTDTANIYSKPIAGQLKVIITGAGDTKSGTVYLWVSDN